jgi:DNA-binding NarL/FixJ family response regulator
VQTDVDMANDRPPDMGSVSSGGGSGSVNGSPDGYRHTDQWDTLVSRPLGITNGAFAVPGDGRDERRPVRDPRVLIVDDSTLHRETLASVFSSNGLPPPGLARDLPTMVAALTQNVPNLVLINHETRDCAVLLQAISGICPGARVIVLGVSEDDESGIVACAEAGVAGYHLRTDSIDDLLGLIRRVADGESSCPPLVAAILIRRLSELAANRRTVTAEPGLTSREIQILEMLDMGLSNREIAGRLSIAVHTVKNHVHSLLTKLAVSSRAEAAARYRTERNDDMGPES